MKIGPAAGPWRRWRDRLRSGRVGAAFAGRPQRGAAGRSGAGRSGGAVDPGGAPGFGRRRGPLRPTGQFRRRRPTHALADPGSGRGSSPCGVWTVASGGRRTTPGGRATRRPERRAGTGGCGRAWWSGQFSGEARRHGRLHGATGRRSPGRGEERRERGERRERPGLRRAPSASRHLFGPSRPHWRWKAANGVSGAALPLPDAFSDRTSRRKGSGTSAAARRKPRTGLAAPA